MAATNPMEFEVSFTTQSLNEAARMARHWYYLPVFVVQHLQGLAIVAALVCAGIYVIVQSLVEPHSRLVTHRDRSGSGRRSCIAVLGVLSSQRRQSYRTARSHQSFETATADGVHTTEKSSATNFVPWSTFRGFRDGNAVILLRNSDGSGYRTIPEGGLTPNDVERMRSAVRSHLPELS